MTMSLGWSHVPEGNFSTGRAAVRCARPTLATSSSDNSIEACLWPCGGPRAWSLLLDAPITGLGLIYCVCGCLICIIPPRIANRVELPSQVSHREVGLYCMEGEFILAVLRPSKSTSSFVTRASIVVCTTSILAGRELSYECLVSTTTYQA
ncbi:hypothetical protein B0H21DRAFT_740249 [Amylocystis lapponica]|nr:hypothetical protein B0H21DRAFT_740249 [Amylocystis lapponica]